MAKQITVAYRVLGFGEPRPYLFMNVNGINGYHGSIPGLIDSGADSTVLPAGYAPLLGYTTAEVVKEQATQVGGSVSILRALEPIKAYIPEIEDIVIDLRPIFVEGCSTALWGRSDLLRHYELHISERRQQFTLTHVAA